MAFAPGRATAAARPRVAAALRFAAASALPFAFCAPCSLTSSDSELNALLSRREGVFKIDSKRRRDSGMQVPHRPSRISTACLAISQKVSVEPVVPACKAWA